jgi:cell division protein FtsW
VSGTPAPVRIRPGRGFLDRPMTSLHLVLASGGLLLAVGGVMVFSASMVDSYDTYGTTYAVFTKQLMWIAIGLPAFWLGLRLPPATYRRLAYPALLASAVLLLLVLVPGIGVYAHGARRWIDLGPLQIQPSEPAKLALALWGADLLVRKEGNIREWKHLLVPLVPVGTVLCALVMLEPDLGTTLCFILVLIGLLWTVGAPARLFGAFVASTAVLVCLLILIEPYRMDRLTAFLDPFQDRSDTGYQAVQGLYSLSTGGFFGAGLGQSKMKWGLLPNAHTDYIFAILGEELGLVGCLVVLALFATLAYTGLQRIPRRVTDPFVRLVSATVTIWLCGQALINIGYVTGMLPVTGIPLPLISFGGTSLVLTMFVLGMLASFARHEPAAVAHLRSRPPGRLSRLLAIPLPSPTPNGRARPAVRRPAATRAARPGQPERRSRMKAAQAGTTRRTATARATQARTASRSGTPSRGPAPARGAAVPAVTLAPRPLTRGSARGQRR